MDVRRVVGKNVRRYRIEAGLSQDELAAGMGVEEGYVGRLERGGKNPTIVTICHAAEALGVGPAAFSIQAIKTNCEADKGYKDTLGNMSLGSRSHFSSDFMQLLGRPCEPPAACGGRLHFGISAQSSSIGSSVQYDGSVSTSRRYPAILRSWQASHVYVRKMPRASYCGDHGLPEPQEHAFGRHCLGMRAIFSSVLNQ
jgi:transcriptional regulator with XRE-family HTH domain